ncbi:MAG: tetratricopeptide repeat protein [Planctomycetota bacterium]
MPARHAVAHQQLETILEANPDDIDAVHRLGHLQKLRGDLPAAEAAYKKVLSLAGPDEVYQAIAYGNLGNLYQTRGDSAGARDSWNRSRRLFAEIGMPHRVEQVQGWLDALPGEGDALPSGGKAAVGG